MWGLLQYSKFNYYLTWLILFTSVLMTVPVRIWNSKTVYTRLGLVCTNQQNHGNVYLKCCTCHYCLHWSFPWHSNTPNCIYALFTLHLNTITIPSGTHALILRQYLMVITALNATRAVLVASCSDPISSTLHIRYRCCSLHTPAKVWHSLQKKLE